MTSTINNHTRTTLFTDSGEAFTDHVREYGFALLRDAPERGRCCGHEHGRCQELSRGLRSDRSCRGVSGRCHRRGDPSEVPVIGPNVKAMQSMLFLKSEGKPRQAWHQDESFIPRGPLAHRGVGDLDDVTFENGCLWLLPSFAAPRRHLPRSDAGRSRFRLHQRARRLSLSRRGRYARGGDRRHGRDLQRLSAPPLPAELRATRIPPLP